MRERKGQQLEELVHLPLHDVVPDHSKQQMSGMPFHLVNNKTLFKYGFGSGLEKFETLSVDLSLLTDLCTELK